MVKLAVLIFFIVVAFTAFNADNFHPFAPHGHRRRRRRPAVIFFAYIGFDAVSTGERGGQEPGATCPIAIIGSLVICTVLYVLVAIAALGVAADRHS